MRNQLIFCRSVVYLKKKTRVVTDMATKKRNTDEILMIAKNIFHTYYSGDLDYWFSFLCPQSIYLGTGEPMLFGADAIKLHFSARAGNPQKILEEEYFPIQLSNRIIQVCGSITVGLEESDYKAITHFTMTFQLIGSEIILIHQHNSYEYMQQSAANETMVLPMDINTAEFVRQLLLDKNKNAKRITLKCKTQSIAVNTNSILYIQGHRKTTEVVCLDRIISCNRSIGELEQELPVQFYRIHKGYIVNKQYIVSVRRFEAELISGITLPIPAARYKKIRQELLPASD